MRPRRLPFHALIPEASLKYSLYCSFLLALTLSACGGSSDTNPSTNSPAAGTNSPASGGGTSPQLLASTPQIIGYYGDSTIWGLKSRTAASPVQVATPAPVAFAQAVADTARHTVSNKGVTGSTACDLLNGNTQLGMNNDWTTEMAGSNATVVIINDAINDLSKGESLNQYTACLNGLADTAKARGKKVIFETPNPVDNNGLDAYVTAMKNVAAAKKIPVIDEYTYLNNQLNDTYTIRDMVPDGTHPSDNVYIQKGQYAAGVFKQLPSNF